MSGRVSSDPLTFLKLCQSGHREKLQDFVRSLEDDVEVKKLLCYSAKRSGDTAAIVAARHGHQQILALLSELGVDLEQHNADGKRCLHEAAAAGHLECVKFLLAQNVQVDSLKRADWTPLMLACTKARKDVISCLVSSGANPQLANKDGWNILHIAAREGHAEIINYILDICPDIWKTTSHNGRTPLHTAALHGKSEAVEILLKRCGYMTDTPDSCGSTPLMDTLRGGHTDIADMLCTDHKAGVRHRDSLGRQAIHLSAQAGCLVSLEYLVTKHGIGVDEPALNSEMTPIHFAAKEGHTEAVRFLIDHGVELNSVDKSSRSALHFAAAAGHVDCVNYLIHQQADMSQTDIHGNTPFDLALKPAVKVLFQRS